MGVNKSIRVPTSRQGQTGMGQGGFTCQQFVGTIKAVHSEQDFTVALRSQIPLETDLEIVELADRWHLIDPADPATVIMEAVTWEADFATTEAVSIEQARHARDQFPLTAEDHPAPHCLSCGTSDRSLKVHAGGLGDGRWATPFRLPDWSLIDGQVDESLVWMAVDCSCGWYVSHSASGRQALTVQFAVQIHDEIRPNTDYALVAWNGDYEPGWDGRKRGAAASLFDTDGNCVAQSRSFWVALS